MHSTLHTTHLLGRDVLNTKLSRAGTQLEVSSGPELLSVGPAGAPVPVSVPRVVAVERLPLALPVPQHQVHLPHHRPQHRQTQAPSTLTCSSAAGGVRSQGRKALSPLTAAAPTVSRADTAQFSGEEDSDTVLCYLVVRCKPVSVPAAISTAPAPASSSSSTRAGQAGIPGQISRAAYTHPDSLSQYRRFSGCRDAGVKLAAALFHRNG